jgi:hypothetical protein
LGPTQDGLRKEGRSPVYCLDGIDIHSVSKALITPQIAFLLPEPILLLHFQKTQLNLDSAFHGPGAVLNSGEKMERGSPRAFTVPREIKPKCKGQPSGPWLVGG